MHIPLKRHVLDLNKRHTIEHVAFALEYGAESRLPPQMPFPRSPQDVMATSIVCFECAAEALDAAADERLAVPTEHTPFERRRRIKELAALSWVELLRAAERTQALVYERMLGVDAMTLSDVVVASHETSRDDIAVRFRQWDGLYTSLSRTSYAYQFTVAEHLVYWTTYQPALLRACYVAERHDGDLALRMLDRTIDRVLRYDELRCVKANMHYALAQMYRLDRRYLEAIHELRKLVQSDCGTVLRGLLGR